MPLIFPFVARLTKVQVKIKAKKRLKDKKKCFRKIGLRTKKVACWGS